MHDPQLDVGIDWLTVASNDTASIAGLVEDVLRSLPGAEPGRPWTFLGYVGESVVSDDGHLAWGVKVGHGLVQMSGAWSDRVFRNLEQFRLMDYRCTRLDLAVTVCLPVARQLVGEALTTVRHQERNYTAITKTNGEGGTLYIGCRASDQFGRLYDKGAEIRSRLNKESLPNAVLWRYEVEYKRSLATAMREALRVHVQNRAVLESTIVQFVHDWYLQRGVSPTFSPGTRSSSVVQVATRVTNVQKTLDWLRVQVRPAIARIAPRVETQAILEALGVELDGSAWVHWRSGPTGAVQSGLWDIDPTPL